MATLTESKVDIVFLMQLSTKLFAVVCHVRLLWIHPVVQ